MATASYWRRKARSYAKHAGINPRYFARQINAESGFDPNSGSPAGAIGIAQFMPGTAASLHINPRNPRQALKGAAHLMAHYLNAYHGSWRNALTAYNAGPGTVGHGLPAETSAYIAKILGGSSGTQTPPSQGGGGGGGGGGSSKPKPWQVQFGQKLSFDQQGFKMARNRAILGSLIARDRGTDSPLFKAGLLTTEMPNPRDFQQSVLTSKIIRPHGGSGGGGGGGARAGRGRTGGVLNRGNLGRTDQGVDFSGSGPVRAPADGTITRVVPRGGGSGWPGGGFVVLKLAHPPDSRHRYIYLAENISPSVRVGQRVRAGQKLAHAHGSYPFLEIGWAADANGTTLARVTSGYSEGQRTPAGKSFLRWLKL